MADNGSLGKDDKRPGHYDSPLADYPGFIRFPHPLQLAEFQAWWKVAIDPIKKQTSLDFETFNFEWFGARELLVEFGEWGIAAVPVGKVKKDLVPLDLMSWVADCADDYIFPQLSKKKRARLLTLT